MNAELITPEEVAQRIGKTNAETVRIGLRNGTFPIGFAYQGKKGWIYVIPREPFEHFLKTGQVKQA
ncbi:MAG: hypothetical protein LBS36_13670 [Oscillospiraceae bacterium]|nr:hypothetical protein [Oscillospiraceae bacterium]